ncbi:MAG: hypothetical protein GX940_08210 [Clostridiaceae bacterium]|nr:hypothetical protein [Clostridiaceae bacterium]
MKRKYIREREFIIRYTGESGAADVIRRLLDIAAGCSGQSGSSAGGDERCRGDGTGCENKQGGGICQDKQG